jgi:glycosyltransferase involved in cell wall biosynthesis
VVEFCPLVTVGIPTYNRPDGLRKILECICKQTYSNLEIIVSDNFSTNAEVQQVISGFAIIDKRIVNVKQPENVGIIKNFRFVLQKAKGDFFMWAADDDFFENDFIENCMRGFQKSSNVVLSTTSCLFISSSGKVEKSVNNIETVNLPVFVRVKNIISYCIEAPGPNAHFYGIYNKVAISSIVMSNKWKRYWGVDVVTILKLSAIGDFAHCFDYYGFHYYLTGESYTKEQSRSYKFNELFFYLLFPVNFFYAIVKMRSLTMKEKLQLLRFTRGCFKGSHKGQHFMRTIIENTKSRIKVFFSFKKAL